MENPRTVIYKKALTGNIFGVLDISSFIYMEGACLREVVTPEGSAV